MPRKSKIEPIMGLGRSPDNALTVQKSLPLFALWRSGLTLAEFKILDTYLSRIDSHKPERRTVIFTKGELEKLLGMKQLKPEVLDERLKHLMQTTVPLQPKGSKRIDRITLFERGQADQDEDGQWTASLSCTPAAMKYIFNIEKLGYLRYKLRCITRLKSLYSYFLFTYLECNRFRAKWDVSLDELKAILGCDTEETYKQYKRFNDLLLKKCQKELHEKTECRFTYEPIRKGRSVAAIHFELETLNDLESEQEQIPGQISFTEISEPSDLIGFLSGACPEFSREEMEEIISVLATIPENKLPANTIVGGEEFRRYHYLEQKYAAMKRAATKNPIKNRFAYFKKILKSDAGLE